MHPTTPHDSSPSTRSPGPSYHELLDRDTRPECVPLALRWRQWEPLGDHDLPAERYTDRAFHELEKERVWDRVWQMACREEHLPEVGDTYVYDICDRSYLLVRSAPDRISAFPNACLHRGRLLRERDGRVADLRCPFHGFCWHLDGSLKQVPSEWDFTHVRADECSLPALRVGTWGGFVFVNPDPAAAPLEDFLGLLPEQFSSWPLERRYTAVHVARVVRANWKVTQEAFMEAFHVASTHPQLLPAIGDTNSQYDWSGNLSRAITPNGTPSPSLRGATDEQLVFDTMTGRRPGEPSLVALPDGTTARAAVAAGARARLARVIGADEAERLSDAELADSFYYTLFPNLHPWGAYNRITYRFRPFEDRHDTSVMECMFLDPYDPSQPRPAPAPVHWLEADQPWTDAPELGMLAQVFEQDMSNLRQVQRGLASLRKGVTLATYQETKVRHFHSVLDQWIARDPDHRR